MLACSLTLLGQSIMRGERCLRGMPLLVVEKEVHVSTTIADGEDDDAE